MTIPASVTSFSTTAFNGAYAQLHIPAEDSQIALILIDNEIPFTSEETGIKESSDRYLDRNKTNYYSTFSSVSASGLVTLSVKYDFNQYAKKNASNLRLKIRIPSTVAFSNDSVRIDGVTSTYSLNNKFLYIDLTKTSGTVTFSVVPESSEYLMSYALMEYRLNGNSKSEIVGILNMAMDTFTLNVPTETQTSLVPVNGIAAPDSDVVIYVNGNEIATVTTNRLGAFSKSIRIPNAISGEIYRISAKSLIADKEKEITAFVKYNEEAVVLSEFTMYFNGTTTDLISAKGTSPMIMWASRPFTFVAKFVNSDNIETINVISTKGDEIKKIKGVWDSEKQAFVASGYFDPTNTNYVPGTISLEYKTKEVNCYETAAVTYEGAYGDGQDVSGYKAKVKLDDGSTEFFYAREIDHNVSFTPTDKYEMVTKDGKTCYMSKDIIYIERTDNCFACQELYMKNSNGSYDVVRSGIVVYGTTLSKSSVLSGAGEDPAELYKKTQNIVNILTDLPEKNTDDVIYTVLNDYVVELQNATDPSSPEYYELQIIKTELDVYNLQVKSTKTFDYLNKFIDQATSVSDDPWYLPDFSDEMKDCVDSMHDLADNINNKQLKSIIQKLSDKDGFLFFDKESIIEKILNEEYKKTDVNVNWRWNIDPSGYAYEAVPSNRVSGAKTTIYYKDAESGEAVLWDASEYEQSNPLYTDANGCYAWDVPEGLWQVKFEKDGYETTYSEWLPVPPPQLEVNIGMNSLSAPEVKYVNVYQDGIEIGFTQYMNIDSVNSTNVKFTSNGAEISGDFEATDAEFNYDETVQYAKTFFFTPKKDNNGTVDVSISNAENYCSTKMSKAYSKTHDVMLRIDSINVAESEVADYKADKSIVVQAYPAKAAEGKVVNVTMSNDYIAKAESLKLTFDKDGKATLKLATLLPGDVDITFAIEDTALSAKTTLSVTLAKEYKITWNVDGETTTQMIREGTRITAPSVPEKTGFKFVGWTPAVPSVMPAEDITFTAVFEKINDDEPTTEPTTKPTEPTTKPTEPTTKPTEPTTKPTEPTTKPVVTVPALVVEIRNPSQTEIKYGDSIILHADVENLPDDATIKWTADNGNFTYTASADGTTCTVSPSASGDTTFTATVYDADGNEIGSDTQTMTAKAGLWQKIVAFFKKLFGMTKVYSEIFERR